jgi:hypothetical protein
VGAQIRFKVCKEIEVKLDNEHWYQHVPKLEETIPESKVIILRDQQVHTDRTVSNNKPDVTTSDNEKGTCMPIDTAISGDRNVTKTQAEKILQYKDLATETQDMCNVKTQVMLVTTEGAWTILKSLRKYLSDILGKHENRDLQRTATLCTAHLPRNVIMSRCKTVNMGYNVTCTID